MCPRLPMVEAFSLMGAAEFLSHDVKSTAKGRSQRVPPSNNFNTYAAPRISFVLCHWLTTPMRRKKHRLCLCGYMLWVCMAATGVTDLTRRGDDEVKYCKSHHTLCQLFYIHHDGKRCPRLLLSPPKFSVSPLPLASVWLQRLASSPAIHRH